MPYLLLQMQVEAERKKRAAILESEGQKEAVINRAEGEKRSRILASEAMMQEKINEAQGFARAIELQAEARKKGLDLVASSLVKDGGVNAASLAVAEQYVTAFGHLAKETNTLVLPANTGDANSMVAQALAIFKQLNSTPTVHTKQLPTGQASSPGNTSK